MPIKTHPSIPSILPWLIAITFFMQMLDGTILNTALPEIAKSIKENPLQIQSVVVAYLLTIAFFLPVSGWLADKMGSRKVFLSAIFIFTLGSFFCAISQTLFQLILSRIFQGVGGALMVPVGRLIIIKLYPKEQLVQVLSFIMLPALFGPLIGPVAGGFLTEYLSWHWIFLINIPIGFLALLLCWKNLPEIKEETVKNFDWFGFAVFSSAILSLCSAFNESKLLRFSFHEKTSLFLFSCVFFGIYWFYSKKKKAPLFEPDIMGIRSFAIGALGNLLARIGGGSVPFLTPLLLQVGLKLSPSQSGLSMLAIGVSMITAKTFVVRVLEFFGYKKFLIINTVFLGLLLSSFGFVSTQTPHFYILILLALFGAVNSMQFTAMTTLTLIDLPKRFSSEGNSILSVIMQVAITLGVSVGATVLNFFSEKSEDIMQAFHMTYLFIGIFTTLSAISFVYVPNNAGKFKEKTK